MRLTIRRMINIFAMACIRFGVAIIDRREDIAFLRFRANSKGYHIFAFSADGDPKAVECLKYLREVAVRQMEVRHETDL